MSSLAGILQRVCHALELSLVLNVKEAQSTFQTQTAQKMMGSLLMTRCVTHCGGKSKTLFGLRICKMHSNGHLRISRTILKSSIHPADQCTAWSSNSQLPEIYRQNGASPKNSPCCLIHTPLSEQIMVHQTIPGVKRNELATNGKF